MTVPRLLAILGLLVAVSLPTFFSRGLWNPDEPRYAQVASEMAIRSDYLVPRLNREVYPEKPPLFFWLTLAANKLFGRENATRCLSLLAGLGVVLFTFLIGKRLLGEREGLYGALVLATSGLFAILAQVGNMDTLLTFLTTFALFCFLKSRDRAGGRGWLFAAYLSMGLATLTKGPVGLALPYLVILVWLIYLRGKGALREGHLLWGIVVALIVVGLWFGPACLIGGSGYFDVIMKRQIAGRAVGAWSHRQPFFYYLLVFPLIFLPWTGLMPGALRRAWQKRGEGEVLLIVWFAVIFIFFSIISSKRERYLMPLFPAASLLAGRHLTALQKENRGCLSPFVFFIVLSLAMAALYFLPLDFVVRPIERYYRSGGAYELLKGAGLGAYVLGLALALAGLSLLGIRCAKRGKVAGQAMVVAAIVLVLSLLTNFTVLKMLDPVKSFREFTAELKTKTRPGESVALWREWFNGAVNFYLEKGFVETLYEEYQLEDFAHMGRSFTLIFSREDFDKLSGFSKERLKVLTRGKNGNFDLVSARFTPEKGDLRPDRRRVWLEKVKPRLSRP